VLPVFLPGMAGDGERGGGGFMCLSERQAGKKKSAGATARAYFDACVLYFLYRCVSGAYVSTFGRPVYA